MPGRFEKVSAQLYACKEACDELEARMDKLQEELDSVTEKLVMGEASLQQDDLRAELSSLQTAEASLAKEIAEKRTEQLRLRQELRKLVLDPPSEEEDAHRPEHGAQLMKSLMSTTMFGTRTGGGRSMMAQSGMSGGGGGESVSATEQWKIVSKELNYNVSDKSSLLGSGAFGDVFVGKFKGKRVAIKRLTQQQFDDETLAAFEAEVSVMARLRHPNILLFIGACTAPGNLSMVTEVMKHGSVKDLMLASNSSDGIQLSAVTRYGFMRDAALGMAYIHGLTPDPVLHLDLKSANLLVDEDFHVKVCDFGLAQIKSKTTGKAGSPLYMAPEILLDREYDTKADVYSFAICMWELAAGDGREPYGGKFEKVEDVAEAVAKRGDRPELFSDLDEVHGRALSKGQSADQLRRGSSRNLNRSGGTREPGELPLPSVPTKMIQLIQACWNPTPRNRPSFGDMVGDQRHRSSKSSSSASGKPTVFAEISVHSVISKQNSDMRGMWVKAFGDAVRVPFSKFLEAFSSTIGFDIPAEADDDIRLACLKALCVVQGRPGAAHFEEVDVEDFGKVCEWLGPVKAKSGPRFLEQMEGLLRTRGFHGFVETGDAEKTMAGKKPGTYLLRFSTRDPGCYAITVLSKSGVVRHYRVWHKAGAKYILGNVEHDTIAELIRHHRKELYLKYPQSGGRFDDMFRSFDRNLVAAGYMDNDS